MRDWMLQEHHRLKGNALINAPRSNFYLVVEFMILMLSRILEKEDGSKFKKEFVGFIVEMAKGRKIKWSKMLSDTCGTIVVNEHCCACTTHPKDVAFWGPNFRKSSDLGWVRLMSEMVQTA